uniref:Uncharacterized protein n=1 Tax=Panagrellus redivivus TaxID=6233 RepID=A0A7E4WB52_PANRE
MRRGINSPTQEDTVDTHIQRSQTSTTQPVSATGLQSISVSVETIPNSVASDPRRTKLAPQLNPEMNQPRFNATHRKQSLSKTAEPH